MLDVLGLDLAAAEKYLREAGKAYRVRETVPAGKDFGREDAVGSSVLRVIGQREESGGIVLVVCRIPDPFTSVGL